MVALAKAYFQEGSLEAAEDSQIRALDLARENASSLQIGMALGVRAQIQLKQGESGPARETSREAVVELRDGGSLIHLARGLATEFQVLEACGAHPEAEASRDEAIALFERLGAHLDLRQIQTVAG
ncbi:hypothetical protein D3C72_1821450 [compost metagenome]